FGVGEEVGDRQGRGAQGARINAQAGEFDPEFLPMIRHQAGIQHFFDRIYDPRLGFAQPVADDHQFRVETEDEVHGPHPQVFTNLVKQVDHLGVSLIGQANQGLQIDFPIVSAAEDGEEFRLLHQRVFRCVKLPASLVSATAFFTVHFDRGVSNLSGKPGDPLIEFSIQHNSCTNADPDADIDEIGGFLAGTVQLFPQGSRVGLIVDPYGHLKFVVDHPFQIHIFPSEIGGKQDRSVVADDAGNPDADTDDAVGAGGRLIDHCPQILFQEGEDLFVGQILVRGDLLMDDISLQVGQNGQQIIDAQVDADGITGHLVEHEHDGPSTAAGTAGSDLVYQVIFHQVVDNR